MNILGIEDTALVLMGVGVLALAVHWGRRGWARLRGGGR